jgi:hypothetical protein
VAADVGAVDAGCSRGGLVMGGFAARVVAGLQELAEVGGHPDAADPAVLYVRSVDVGKGLDIPVGEVLLPAPGRLALAPDSPLVPVLPDVRG